MNRLFACMFCLLLARAYVPVAVAGEQPAGPQTSIGKVTPPQKMPLVIMYTLSNCPHCREAKDYFTRNNIPFVNREVDADEQHMEYLMKNYDAMNVPDQKRGVPLIVIGEKIRLQGFNVEKFEKAMKKAMQN